MCGVSFEWPVDRTCLPELPVLGGSPTEQEQAAYDDALATQSAAEDLAIQVLWALSARQFGLYETTVRPCRALWRGGYPYMSPYLLSLDSGHWTHLPCACVGDCTVSGPRVVHLPGPVDEITEVVLAGVVLADSGYKLEGDVLYRCSDDFDAVWPAQDLGRPLGEPGTWSVKYKRGWPVPSGVDKLTGQLAREFLLACDGDDECRLPRTVVATTRRGVSHQFDPSKILADGKTGLTEVDSWLAAVNPSHLAQASVVL